MEFPREISPGFVTRTYARVAPYFGLKGRFDDLQVSVLLQFILHRSQSYLAIKVATLTGCMPLSTATKSPLQEQQKVDENTNHKKRKYSSDNNQHSPTSVQSNKKFKGSSAEMTDAQKRANFSALTSPSNGFNRHASPLANSKPGAAKKLVIKNFKGELTLHESPAKHALNWSLSTWVRVNRTRGVKNWVDCSR